MLLSQLRSIFEELSLEKDKSKPKSFYSKQPGKVNLSKLKKVQMIISYLERLADLIKSFEVLNLTQIM